MCARGLSDSLLYLVTISVRVPYEARNRAADAPAGPDPTTRTSVSATGCPPAAVVIASLPAAAGWSVRRAGSAVLISLNVHLSAVRIA